MIEYLLRAAEIALPTYDADPRNFHLGCLGIRKDGAIVSSRNGAVFTTANHGDYAVIPNAHAEVRALKKLGHGGTLFVARVSRQHTGHLVMARPCPMCQTFIRSAKVSKVYYTINNEQYGLFIPAKDQDFVFNRRLR